MHLLLPADVVVVEADEPSMWEEGLLAEEAAALGPRAVAKRRREFTAGRNCARLALAGLGLPPAPVLSGAGREPVWPPGAVGSITHTDGYCAVAVARRERVTSIGIDAERHAALPAGVEELVCTEGERRWARMAAGSGRTGSVHWPAVIFSAKESIYKAWFPIARRWLGFEDAELSIDPDRCTFAARLSVSLPPGLPPGQEPFTGRFAVTAGYVLTAVVVPAQ